MASCPKCGAADVELATAEGQDGLFCERCRPVANRDPSDDDVDDVVPTDVGAGADAEESKPKKESQATVLIGLGIGAGAELFRTPDGDAYATIAIDGRRETWPLRTKTVKRWLARLYYESCEKAPGSQAIADALGVLEGMALFDGVEHSVHTRVAAHDSAVYLDLADPEWRAVEITAAGWRVVADPPVRFIRARGMLALPAPVGGGSLDELRPFLNYGSESDFRLMVSWLAMTLRAAGPYPVLALHGEQGSGKSTAAEMLRMLVDPNKALLRPPPRDERDLVIAGSNGRVVALENLSSIPQWLSDALCRISTGSGFSTRELYSDADETIFAVQLPIVLNGIVEVVVSGDLQDRAIVLTLPRITGYASEDDLWDDFMKAQPQLLGGLLDVVSHAMANEPRIHLADPPRMADFARWTAAAAPALGWDPDQLLDAYAENRAGANETTLDASPLVAPLRTLGVFEGSATELLEQLGKIVGEAAIRSKAWPKTPSALSGALRRLAPNMRRASPSLEIAFGREGRQGEDVSRRRLIWVGDLDWVRDRASTASTASTESLDVDGVDGVDGSLRTHSNGPVEATETEEATADRIAAEMGAEV